LFFFHANILQKNFPGLLIRSLTPPTVELRSDESGPVKEKICLY
jgi:hypothetical protein